jgi:hypothetical protein
MKLYHGSYTEVQKPVLLPSNRALDFGKAFYLTSDYEQAKKWAKLTAERRKTASAVLNEFDFDDTKLSDLNVLHFESADHDWLKFVSECRTNRNYSDEYDLISGPVANDQTFEVIQLYFIGAYDEEEALRRLLPFKLKDQYAFKTEKSLELLTFRRAVFV